MTIGTALIIIALLYFIDKHAIWRKAAAVCVVAIAVTMIGLTGYYGWQRWHEKKAWSESVSSEKKTQSSAGEIDLSAGFVPKWDIPSPHKDFVREEVSYAILDPVKTDEKAKTDSWIWYRDSGCVTVGAQTLPPNHILHDRDLFGFDSYDSRWMSSITVPQNVKHALWSAKVAECRLHHGTKLIKACLDRTTGTIDMGPAPEKWAQYLTSCGPKMEMIYLNSAWQNPSDQNPPK